MGGERRGRLIVLRSERVGGRLELTRAACAAWTAREKAELPGEHQEHLIDLQSGRVVEFRNEQIEKLQQIIADELGYELVGHRLELYAVPRRGKAESGRE